MPNTPDKQGSNQDRPTTGRPDANQPDERRPQGTTPGQGKDRNTGNTPGRKTDDPDAT